MTTGYPTALKAQVLAEVLTGDSVSAIARRHNISRQSVIQWRAAAGIDTNSVLHEKRDELGRLALVYLEKAITALGLQSDLFGDRAWLEKQPAGELAILHGVISDKTVRLLSALRGESEESAPTTEPG